MSIPDNIKQLTGDWKGTNRLWLSPTDPARESETTAEVMLIGGGRFLSNKYTWVEGEKQEVMFVLGRGGDEIKAFWLDSWHNGDRIMPREGTVGVDGRLSVLGSYPASPGLDWGWRIVIEPGETLHLCMFNIMPAGVEMLAVEAAYTRQPRD